MVDGLVGEPRDLTAFTKVVEFNDVPALEAALAPGDVACVLAEPVMTNIGMVLPQPGFLEALRELTTKTGTLLILDETHTLSSGPGGYARAAQYCSRWTWSSANPLQVAFRLRPMVFPTDVATSHPRISSQAMAKAVLALAQHFQARAFNWH